MGDIALALCGGGGKGAFQIGAWRSLIEHGVMDNVKAISGTSVGALNAVLLAIGDFENAKKIWYGITKEDMLSPCTEKNVGGICSRDGLEMILEKVPLEELHSSSIDVYVTIFNTSELKAEYIHLNELSVNEMIKYLLASSAILALYPSVEIEQEKCIDAGGVDYWNTPIDPLYNKGYKNIYILSMAHDFSTSGINNAINVNARRMFSDCDIKVINPKEDMGGLLRGTINFSQAAIRTKMVIGYASAEKMFSKEEGIDMGMSYTYINVQIKQKMEKLFSSSDDIENFIKAADFTLPDMQLPTLGGKIMWENIVDMFGWKIQKMKNLLPRDHKTILPLIPLLPVYKAFLPLALSTSLIPLTIGSMHTVFYRILDSKMQCRVFVSNPEDILNELINYESTIKFNDD